VEHLLHVIVLLELVDDRQHSVASGPAAPVGTVQMYSCSADGRDAARLERLLQVAEVGERRTADHQLRLALSAGALAHLLEAVVDEVSSRSS
jgi:hypothetical protein